MRTHGGMAQRVFFCDIFCATANRNLWSFLLARLNRRQNLASVRASRPELPQPSSSSFGAGPGGFSPSYKSWYIGIPIARAIFSSVSMAGTE
jgi:hypothetical protein